MRIRDLREDADITQKEIAAYLHIRQNTYSQYENGQRQLPVNVLIALAKYYRLHHAIPMVQLRSRIFRQTIQKAAGCSGATAKVFVKYDGKDASKCAMRGLCGEAYKTSADYILGLTDEKKPYGRRSD